MLQSVGQHGWYLAFDVSIFELKLCSMLPLFSDAPSVRPMCFNLRVEAMFYATIKLKRKYKCFIVSIFELKLCSMLLLYAVGGNNLTKCFNLRVEAMFYATLINIEIWLEKYRFQSSS